jgi:hypothetical protein
MVPCSTLAKTMGASMMTLAGVKPLSRAAL